MDGNFAQLIESALGALCPGCGGALVDEDLWQPVTANDGLGGLCQRCQQRLPPSERGMTRQADNALCSSGIYQGSLRQMILRAKASPHSPAWLTLYRRLRRQVLAAGICPQWITVPPPSWKRRWQGWHLAAELARKLAQDLGCQYGELLRRRKQRPAQAGLGANARRQNLEGAFALGGGVQNRLPPSLWILDDVWTTGATFEECKRVLEQAGVYVHGAILLAHVDNLQAIAVDETKLRP